MKIFIMLSITVNVNDSIYLRGDVFSINYLGEELKWLISLLALVLITFPSLQHAPSKLLDTIINLDVTAY